jgi:hypothetical protein
VREGGMEGGEGGRDFVESITRLSLGQPTRVK